MPHNSLITKRPEKRTSTLKHRKLQFVHLWNNYLYVLIFFCVAHLHFKYISAHLIVIVVSWLLVVLIYLPVEKKVDTCRQQNS